MISNKQPLVFKTVTLSITAFIALIFPVTHAGQPPLSSTDWVRLQSESGDISIALPSDGWMIDVEEGETRIHRSVTGMIIHLVMKPRSDAKSEFLRLANTWWKGMDVKQYEFNDFVVGQTVRNTETRNVNRHYTWMYLASSKGAYTIAINANGSALGLTKSILASLQLNQKPIFATSEPVPMAAKTLSADKLTTNEVVTNALSKPDSKQSKLVILSEKTGKEMPVSLDTPLSLDEQPKTGTDEDILDRSLIKYSRQLTVLRRPSPKFPSSGLRSGLVRLRVEFKADGTIGEIGLVESAGRSYDEAAFKAARKIKFIPAMVDGKPIDVAPVLPYSFRIVSRVVR